MKLHFPNQRGFALIVTLSLMVLLAVVAVGLLSLSTIALRSTSLQNANEVAKSNARLALMLALGELQKNAGDDRRITADGAFEQGSAHPDAVGVWRSWSPQLTPNPERKDVDYDSPKSDNFISWLVSAANPAELTNRNWAKTGTLVNPIPLFTEKSNGFNLSGSKLPVSTNPTAPGAYAWAITQNATKAKINIGGPEDAAVASSNDALNVQPRPSLAQSGVFGEPTADFNKRAARVISISQSKLDGDLWLGEKSMEGGRDFTTQGFGLVTDVVHGGLKTDLSLGFELSDAEFSKETWDDTANPFRAASVSAEFSTPAAYRGERPLFMPITETGSVKVKLDFPPALVKTEFPNAAVPTFATLRSFYRTPYHLYNTADGPTVFERGADHVSFVQPAPGGNEYYPPGASPPGEDSHVGFSPILDRIIFVVGVGLSPSNELRLTFTPIITLWNPYDVALDFEGAVAYPWIDLPFDMTWRVTRKNSSGQNRPVSGFPRNVKLSTLMGEQLRDKGLGRSVDPYFYATITSGGNGTIGSPIRFEPGEIRVFGPSGTVNTEYVSTGNDRSRTVLMAPVTNPNQLSTMGGLSVPLINPKNQHGFTYVLKPDETVQVDVNPAGGRGLFFISMEDASRTKQPAGNTSTTRSPPIGQIMGDIQTRYFSSGASAMKSPILTFNQLVNEPLAFGLIESYHKVARDQPGANTSDLLFTANPRHAYISTYVTRGSFAAAPHYQTTSRSVSGLADVIQTSNGGRSAFYGETNSPATGRSHLSFFEVPREPMLSLAAFQHADLSSTAFSAANQTGNSWAPGYLPRDRVALLDAYEAAYGFQRDLLPIYDTPFLTNEALWDSFFFSSAAPTIEPGNTSGSPAVWRSSVAKVTRSLKETLTAFIDDPVSSPLRNTRIRFHKSGVENAALADELLDSKGCTRIAAHVMIDGAFNINSTSVPAWAAVLSGLRGVDFEVIDGSKPAADASAMPRMRHPRGEPDDPWQGYRALTEPEVTTLAENIVEEIRLRGPFLSLGEFINRRPGTSDLGLKGALQAAIDKSKINDGMKFDTFDTSLYPKGGDENVVPANTGVGIPGYLTQADLLQSIAPVITPRSDTFTIRGFGEAYDKNGKVLSKAYCEAEVQRLPEYIDGSQPAYTSTNDLNPVNLKFGRRFAIVSFRYLAASEVAL